MLRTYFIIFSSLYYLYSNLILGIVGVLKEATSAYSGYPTGLVDVVVDVELVLHPVGLTLIHNYILSVCLLVHLLFHFIFIH